MIETYEIEFGTSKKNEVKNLTQEVKKRVKKSDVEDGLCLLFAPHATGVLILNENERGIKKDYLKGLKEIAPENNDWDHDMIDNNAHAHIKSAFVGTDRTIPISNGKLDLGRWQDIFFIETDGPRNRRRLIVKILGKRKED